MGFLRRLWHRLLFGSSPLPGPRPTARPAARAGSAAARPAADADAIAATLRQWVKPQPPRYCYRSREELELALLLPWLAGEEERMPFLDELLPTAKKTLPWTSDYVFGEPWEQCQQWGPLVIQAPEMMTTEGFCCLLKAELTYGLSTFCTPLDLLSRPVRMLWLLRQGQRAGQVFAALEQALGSRERAMNHAWWVIAEL